MESDLNKYQVNFDYTEPRWFEAKNKAAIIRYLASIEIRFTIKSIWKLSSFPPAVNYPQVGRKVIA